MPAAVISVWRRRVHWGVITVVSHLLIFISRRIPIQCAWQTVLWWDRPEWSLFLSLCEGGHVLLWNVMVLCRWCLWFYLWGSLSDINIIMSGTGVSVLYSAVWVMPWKLEWIEECRKVYTVLGPDRHSVYLTLLLLLGGGCISYSLVFSQCVQFDTTRIGEEKRVLCRVVSCHVRL